jgi:type IV secretion system protein VirB2
MYLICEEVTFLSNLHWPIEYGNYSSQSFVHMLALNMGKCASPFLRVRDSQNDRPLPGPSGGFLPNSDKNESEEIRVKKQGLKIILGTLGILIIPAVVFASGTSGLPWETPMQTIMKSLTGPVAGIIAAICVCGGFIALGFGNMGSVSERFIKMIIGIAGGLTATSLISTLFGVSVGLGF